MANKELENILVEYEQKRRIAENKLENRKEEIFFR